MTMSKDTVKEEVRDSIGKEWNRGVYNSYSKKE